MMTPTKVSKYCVIYRWCIIVLLLSFCCLIVLVSSSQYNVNDFDSDVEVDDDFEDNDDDDDDPKDEEYNDKLWTSQQQQQQQQQQKSINGSKPNILIILADDLGWGDVSFHGSAQIPTPNLDLLATSGIVLNNYYVQPLCSPSRSALLTARFPIHTGMQVDVIAASQPYGLPLHFPTMGTHFRELGYRTHLIGKWHQGMSQLEYFPTERGFDTYLGYLTGHADYYDRTGGDQAAFKGYDFREDKAHANLSRYKGKYATDLYTDRVVKLIEDHHNDSKPFLIYFAQQSVHAGNEFQQALQPPHRYAPQSGSHFNWITDQRRRSFAGMVTALDESLGRVFEVLANTGQLHNTVIFFSTDNGGASGNGHGSFIDESMGSNYPLKGAKYTLWEGGVRGTAWLWTAQTVAYAPTVSSQLMHIVDVLPTLYAGAAGGDVHRLGENIDGVNLWPRLMNEMKQNDSDDRDDRDDIDHIDTMEQLPNRNQLVHNIDRTNQFWAVRYEQYKLTYSTWLAESGGPWDVWYEAPGQREQHPPSGICYECTPVYQVLKREFGRQLSVANHVLVQCNQTEQPILCHSSTKKLNNNSSTSEEDTTSHLCLFNIEHDPCEQRNLAKIEPEILQKLYKIYQKYDATYVKPVNKPSDVNANPNCCGHNGWWEPWKSLPHIHSHLNADKNNKMAKCNAKKIYH